MVTMKKAAAAFLAACAATHAGAMELDRWSVDGFGTASGTYHDTDGIEYRRNVTQGRGARAGEIDLGTDSLFGLQTRYSFTPEVSAIAQGIWRRDTEGRFRPDLERAYVSFSAGGTVLARAGRIGFDSYLLAESPSVGFSYMPIRPAPEFFGMFVSDALDGADVSISKSIAGGVARLRLLAGHGPGDQVFETGRESAGSRQWGGLLDFTRQAWLVRIGASHVHVDDTADFSPLSNALRFVGTPDALSFADRLDAGGRTILGWNLGIAYDGRPLMAQLLLTRIDGDVIGAPKTNSGVFLAGYRYRHLTPYLSFARIRSFANVHPSGVAGIPELAELDAAIHLLQTSAQATQRTVSLGIKYDVTPHIDLKAQVDRVRLQGSALVLDYTPTRVSNDAQLTVLGLALDFVF